MGKIVEKKRKKKKGRPSLLDLQKRTLKEQQQQLQKYHKQKFPNKKIPNSKLPNPKTPNSSSAVRRSTRRNPNPNSDLDDDAPSSAAASGGGGKRREKKLDLVLKKEDEEDDDIEDEVNSDNDGGNSGSESCHDDDLGSGSNPRKRKIDSISRGSTAVEENDKGEKHSAVATKQASIQQGSKADDGPSTSLPDKSLLLFILDRLQKKDTYGVFSEPVDPEELPDYHEVIDHPMDFGTVRKKLADGAYASLEQFEKDVFLISSNAMQYNAPDTIYFRQARSIQELAVKNFENLRGDSDDNRHQQEPKVVRRGRPPTKNLKRPPGRPPLERANSDFSEATLATAGGTTNRSNNDVRKASTSEKYGSTDSIVRSLYGSRVGDAYIGSLTERYERVDDLTGSASKGISMKHGKKHIVLDENRRNTYKHSYTLACGQESSVLATFNRERKQLIAVGLQAEYGYARSLARFAAKMGPVAWKVASKKIERCLPSAVKFGPGWVGDKEAPEARQMEQASPAFVGHQAPPISVGQQAPPISVGQQAPPISVGQQAPPVSVGRQMTPVSVGRQTPPASVGQQMPPASVGQLTPPVSVGQQTPPASVDQQTPPVSLPALSDTPLSSTQGGEDSGGDRSMQKPQGEESSEMPELCNELQVEESGKALSRLAVDNDANSHSSSILPYNGAEPSLIAPEVSASSPSSTKVNILNNGTRPDNPYPMHQTSIMQSRINGLNGSYGLNFAAQMGKMIGPGRPTMFNLQSNPSVMTVSRTETQSLRPPAPSDSGCGEPKSEENCSTIKPIDCLPNTGSNQNAGSTPPDLNVGFQSPGSPVSAKADSLQPDLALQL